MGMRKWEITKKLDEIVDFAGVAKYLDTPTKRYSSGMKVRLGFAVAAFLEPEILVVDEVLAVGDVEFQKKAIGKMQDVSHGEGRTVLFVSHNMASVKSLCDRGVVLDNGESVFKGKVDDAVSYYLNSTQEKRKIPLKDRTDRRGNGKLKIIDSYLVDGSNQRTEDLISGLPGKLVIEYVRKEKVDVKHLFLSISIFNEQEIFQTIIASDELGFKFQEIDYKGHFTIEFPKLNLRAGTYLYTIFISETRKFSAQYEEIDVIFNAGEIKVLPGDYPGGK